MGRKKQRRQSKPSSSAPEPRFVPRHEQQYALVGDTVLDVQQAHWLLRESPRRSVRIDVTVWALLYGLDGNPASPIGVGPLFDPVHAMTTDLTRPLILATIPTGGDAETQLIIDGSHRLYRAYLEGRDSLPAHILTAAESDAITVARPHRNGDTA